MKKKAGIMTRLWIALISFVIACTLYLSVNTLGENQKDSGFSFLNSTEGVFVIEDLEIDFRYDKTKYEVVPFLAEPYVVIKGDNKLINYLKMFGKPEFFIDLNGKPPGSYREKVQFTGINKALTVEVYPSSVELRVMEQQTIKVTPVIELLGVEEMHEDYVASVPELQKEEVLIRDIQDKINQVGQVKGEIDVSKMTSTQEVEVTLMVYDREGQELKDINLLDKTIVVKVPIEKKITVVKEEVINEIVVIEEIVQESPKDDKEEPTKETPNTQEKPKVDPPPIREGSLSFVNIPPHLDLKNNTTNHKWSGDVKIDLKNFEAGRYEITVNDKGTSKAVNFDLTEKETPAKEESEEEPSGEEEEEDLELEKPEVEQEEEQEDES